MEYRPQYLVGGLIGPLFILGMGWFNDWRSAFYLPAAAATLVAGFIYCTVRDTPQSCGLPSVEEYRDDYPVDYDQQHEQEFSARAIFLKYVLNNKLLWFIAAANAFVYLIRYGVLDWAPTYLNEVKQFSFDDSSWAYFLYEWAGIPGTLLCGYISDRWFKGRRAPAAILYMSLVLIAVIVVLAQPGWATQYRYWSFDGYRFFNLWTCYADWFIRIGVSSQKSCWHRRRTNGSIWLSWRSGSGQYCSRLYGGLLWLGWRFLSAHRRVHLCHCINRNDSQTRSRTHS